MKQKNFGDRQKYERYDINKYYIGQLSINLNDESNSIGKIINEVFLENIDSKKAIIISNNDRIYKVLTIFYSNPNNSLFCIHNLQNYNKETVDYLIPLTEFFPKVNYKIPKNLSIIEAKMIFRYLFDLKYNITSEKIYSNEILPINNFYVGDLYICNNKTINSINDFSNILQKIMLEKSSAKLTLKKQIVNKNCTYEYFVYKCLFYRLNCKLINIHNNMTYENKYPSDDNLNGLSYYKIDSILHNPYKNSCQNGNISIKKALTLLKKYK